MLGAMAAPAAMAAATQQAPMPLTMNEAQARAHKRQLEMLQEDCKRICNLDISRPFSNLQDAVDRLLPFHVLADLSPEDADWEELDAEGGQLLGSRQQAWNEHLLHEVDKIMTQTQSLAQRIDNLDQRLAVRCTQPTVEERILLERWMLVQAQEALNKERVRISSGLANSDDEAEELAPPTAAVAASAAAAAVTATLAAEQALEPHVAALPALSEPVSQPSQLPESSVKQEASDIVEGEVEADEDAEEGVEFGAEEDMGTYDEEDVGALDEEGTYEEEYGEGEEEAGQGLEEEAGEGEELLEDEEDAWGEGEGVEDDVELDEDDFAEDFEAGEGGAADGAGEG